MFYRKVKIENGQLIITSSKQIDQNILTSDCWSIQIGGLAVCEKCEYNGKTSCGGKRLKIRLENAIDDTDNIGDYEIDKAVGFDPDVCGE